VNPRYQRRNIRWLVSTLLVIGLGLAFMRPGRDPSRETDRKPVESDQIPGSDKIDEQTGRQRNDSDLAQQVQSLIETISIGEKKTSHQACRELRGALTAASPKEATDYIRSYLLTGVHLPTGQQFVVGRDGHLQSSPDLRSFLLDILETVNPDAAAIEARHILEVPTRPDEWAVSLRIVCRRAPPDNAYLHDRVMRLLSVEVWLETPTVAYLQAFDASVYTADPEIVDRLLEISDGGFPPPTRYAARLALERTTEATYTSAIRPLIQSDRLSSQPKFRASLIARGDVRIESDRTVLEEYLLRSDPNTAEIEAFARYFPNYNQQVSDNLITTDHMTPIDDRIDQDRATRSWIHEIRDRPEFAHFRTVLEDVDEKLVRYLVSAPAPPPEDDS